MKNIRILNTREVKRMIQLLDSMFGFKERFPYVFLQTVKDKIFVVNRDIGEVDLSRIKVQTIGLYLGTLERGKVRLSIEGAQLIGPKCKHHIIEFDQRQLHEWLTGEKVTIEDIKELEDQAYYLVKYKDEFLGCAKLAKNTLLNFVPKERRLRVVND